MSHDSFQLPLYLDLGATAAFALTGALAAIKRGYDVVGLFALALVTSIGGAIMRDSLLLQGGLTPVLTNPLYIECIAGAVVLGILCGERVRRFHRLIAIVDALGLGAYAVYGVQKSLAVGLAVPAALLVGVINAAGGGVLRDLLSGEEPLVFKPGQFYLLVALGGTVCFVFCLHSLETSANTAALVAIAVTFVFRMLTIACNWRTAPVASGALFHSDEAAPPPAR